MLETVAVFGLGKYQLDGIKQLQQNNFKIIGFDEQKYPFSRKNVNIFYHIPFTNTAKIQNICLKYKVRYLLSFNTEAPLILISKLNKNLNLSGYRSKDIELIANKIKLRNFFKSKMNLKKPKFLSFRNFTEIQREKKLLKFPLVCKPNVGSGSRGVFLARNFIELAKLFQINKNFYFTQRILLEEFIDNNEFAVEGWIYKKKFIFGCLSKKVRTEPPYLLDKNLIINYQNLKIKKKIINFLNLFVKKSNIDNMPVHFEFFERKGNIIPVDISLRGAGFGVYSNILSKIMRQSSDKILINLVMKKKIVFNKPNKKIYFLNFFSTNKKGIFKGIKNVKKLISLDTFSEIDLYKKKNSKVFPLKKGGDRIGHFLLEGYFNSIIKDINFIKKYIEAKVINE